MMQRYMTHNQKQVESILRMSENDQTHGIWAITSTECGNWMTGRRVQGVHWWSNWQSNYDYAQDNRSACAMVTQGDTVVGVVLKDALRVEVDLWRRLCAGCCTSFLKGLDER